LIESRNRPVFEKYIKKHKKEYRAGIERTLNIFNKIVQNYDYRWINLYGMDCMIASLEKESKTDMKVPELTKSNDLWPSIKDESIKDFLAYNKKY
jgi:hypothetical protein